MYLHNSQSNQMDPFQPTQICTFYAKHGTCKFGDGCRFQHDGIFPNDQFGQPSNWQQNRERNQPSQICSFFAKHGTCKFGDGCRFQHDGIFPNDQFGQPSNWQQNREGNQPSQICSFYAKHGTCKFGDGCRFQHDGIFPNDQFGQPSNWQPNREGNQPSQICAFFAKHGTCKFGDGCRFQHDGVVPMQQQLQPCRHFNNGYCQLGSNCKFLHDENQVKVRDFNRGYRMTQVDETAIDRCVHFFSILDQNGQPQGHCPFNKCSSRHFATPQERDEDVMHGWTFLHDIVFHSNYQKLAEILEYCQDYDALLSQRSKQPHTITWSEYDEVDHTSDRYKLTVRAGATPMDVAMTSTNDLDKDSPSSIAVVDYLLGSREGDVNREICIRMLRYPPQAKEFLERIQVDGKYAFLRLVPE